MAKGANSKTAKSFQNRQTFQIRQSALLARMTAKHLPPDRKRRAR